LKSQIDVIEDSNLLKALYTLILPKSESLINLTDGQKEIITMSQKEYSEGVFFEHNQVNEEIEEMAKKKIVWSSKALTI